MQTYAKLRPPANKLVGSRSNDAYFYKHQCFQVQTDKSVNKYNNCLCTVNELYKCIIKRKYITCWPRTRCLLGKLKGFEMRLKLNVFM